MPRYLILLLFALPVLAMGEQHTLADITDMDPKKIALYAAVIFLPGVVAVSLTIIWVTVWRRENRDNQCPPYNSKTIKDYTIKWGAIFGLVSQLGLQRLVATLSGIPLLWELVPLGMAITGIVSMGVYEALKAYAYRRKWYRLFSWLSVKHVPGYHNTGFAPAIDPETLRIFLENDDTVRRGADV